MDPTSETSPETRDPASTEEQAEPAAAAQAHEHTASEAMVLLVLGLAAFWGTTLLRGCGVRLLEEIAPALGVLAWILPAYALVARRGRDPFRVHGVLSRPTHLGAAGLVSLLIVALYVGAFFVFGGAPERPVPWEAVLTRLGYDLAFVALPEEYFFRSVLQPSLDRAEGPRWRLLGAPFGRGVVLAAALFAAAHLVLDASPYRAAVFFPALWFAWLRVRTRSLWPAVVAHTLANALEVACIGAWALEAR